MRLNLPFALKECENELVVRTLCNTSEICEEADTTTGVLAETVSLRVARRPHTTSMMMNFDHMQCKIPICTSGDQWSGFSHSET